MMRVLLDTNIYGELILDSETVRRLLRLIPSKLIVYGSEVNRKELRDVAATAKAEDWDGRAKSKRLLLLNLYDAATQKSERTYRTTVVVEMLSAQYFDEYAGLGGKADFEELRKDFVIVATASIHSLDVVVSKDAKTMFGKEAKKAYETVNRKNQLRMPELLEYKSFKDVLRKLEVKSSL